MIYGQVIFTDFSKPKKK